MKILLWHGYLMRGSGSNIYTANIARSWRSAGHDVLVMCQERDIDVLPFVDEAGDFAPDNKSFLLKPTGAAPGPGRCAVVRPAIGDVLPVYVYDEYAGFRAKTFVDLTDEELASYTARNVDALATAIESFRPDAIITGHEVMGPYIALLACDRTQTSYVAKLHGSALEYAVKFQERYVRYAREGLSGAKVVVGGSRYMVEEASAVVPGWLDKSVVVNPGCDVELFIPVDHSPEAAPTVGYVGKLIISKGVHNLLCSLGLTTTPGLRAVVVGFGGFEDELHELARALRRGDKESIGGLAGDELPAVRDFMASPDAAGPYFARAAQVPVEFTGRLEHGPLSRVLPYWDILVVPSVVPEAFGLVAVEAAACGVLPVVPAHSGIGEVGAALEEELGLKGDLIYDPSDPIRGIAAKIDGLAARPEPERRSLGRAAVAAAGARWSWDRVARDLLDLALAR